MWNSFELMDVKVKKRSIEMRKLAREESEIKMKIDWSLPSHFEQV